MCFYDALLEKRFDYALLEKWFDYALLEKERF